MELPSLFFLLAVLILVGMYLYAPFISRKRRVAADESHEVSALMAERERILNALQELEFDFNLGKVPAEDYPIQRADLLQKGAEVLKKLDAISPSPLAETQGASELNDEDIEALIAKRRRARKNKATGFCPKCGKPILESDRFCPSCGKALRNAKK